MTSHLSDRAAPANLDELPLPPTFAALLANPIKFVTAVWLLAYIAIAFMA